MTDNGAISSSSPFVVTLANSDIVSVTTGTKTQQAVSVVASDITSDPPAPPPKGWTMVSAVSLSVATQAPSASVAATVPYSCSIPSKSIAPFYLNNGGWTEIPSFTANQNGGACSASFQVPDPQTYDIAILQSSSAQGAGSAADTCNNYCEGTSTQTSQGCSSILTLSGSSAQSTSECHLHETLETDFGPGSALTQSGQQGPFESSPAGAVNNYNAQNALALLTCPLTPEASPSDASYFYTNYETGLNPYVAGDACTPPTSTKLDTGLDQQVDFQDTETVVGSYFDGYTCDCTSGCSYTYEPCGGSGSLSNGNGGLCKVCNQKTICTSAPITANVYAPLREAGIDTPLMVYNPGYIELNDIAYSPMLQTGYGDIISSAFSSNEYVFDQVPSVAQHSVWTWAAQFADFSGAPQDSMAVNLNHLQTKYTYSPPTASEEAGWEQEEACCGGSCGGSSGGGGSSGSGCTPPPPSVTVEDYCTLDYNLNSVATLSGVQNEQIQFPIETPGGSQTVVSSQVVPYFTFNAQIPTPDGSELSVSYDVFSPLNYYAPGNSIEMFPIETPGAEFLQYAAPVGDTSYLLSMPEGTLANSIAFSNLIKGAAQTDQPWPANLAALGLTNSEPANPISITGMSNGDVFVLNATCTNLLLGCTTPTYYLNIMRPVPEGYYNTSEYQPDSMPLMSSSLTQWNSNWQGYWANVIALQGNSMYTLDTINLNQLLKNDFALGFTPLNISADSGGDVFMTGHLSYSPLSSQPAIVEIANALSPSQMQVITTNVLWSQNSGGVPVLSEIAATPTGGLVFGASPNDGGTVYAFTTSNLGIYINYPVSLAYSGGSSASPGTAILNISSYLYQGGLYGVPLNGGVVGGFQTPNVIAWGNNEYPQNDFDSAQFHHPLGLQEVGGYLYVLDDWRGCVGTNTDCASSAPSILGGSYGSGTFFDILSVRVLNSTGSNLPVNPTLFNDLWQSQTCDSPVLGSGPTATEAIAGKCYATAGAAQATCGSVCTLASQPCNAAQQQGTYSAGEQYSCVAPSGVDTSGTYYTLATGQYVNNPNPPYGWVLSADILPEGAGETGAAPSVSLVAGDITYAGVAGATMQGSPTIGSGQSVTLTANPVGGKMPYSYEWFSGAGCTGGSFATGATVSVSPTATTTYYYQVQDAASATACSAGDSVTVSASTGLPTKIPTINSASASAQTCGNPTTSSGAQINVGTCYPALVPWTASCASPCTVVETQCNLGGQMGEGDAYSCGTGGSPAVATPATTPSNNEVTFCSSYGCIFNPGNLPSGYSGGYAPVGPKLSVANIKGEPGTSFSVNFNGTIDLLLTGGLLNNPAYSELLTANLNILNYTKILQGQPSYTCYASDSNDEGCYFSSALAGFVGTGVGNPISGPIYTLANPLEYTESVGGAQALSFAGEVASSLPSVASNQGCQSLITGGQGCSSNSIDMAGPPSLTVQQAPVGWGQADLITGQSQQSTDELVIYFNNQVVATGTGTVTYTECGGSDPDNALDCRTPGSYPVSVSDLTAGGAPTANTLTITNSPKLTLQSLTLYAGGSGSSATCTGDLITANALDSTGTVTISVTDPDGNPVTTYGLPASGTGSASYTIPTSAGICGVLYAGEYTITASVPGQKSVSQSLDVYSTAAQSAAATTPTTTQTLTSSVGGYVVVPYAYTYLLSQGWSGFAADPTSYQQTITTTFVCSGNPPPPVITNSFGSIGCPFIPQSITLPTATNTIYSYALINGQSDTLSAVMEGGDTYLASLATSGLYVPNMSDAGLVMPPQVFYTVQNNRIFGEVYINDTGCTLGGSRLDCSSNSQYVLNATRQDQYEINTYAQASGSGGGLGGYATLQAVPETTQQYGASLIAKSNLQQAVTTQNAIGFLYSVSTAPLSFVSLFDLYKEVTYQNPLYLYLNTTQLFENGQAVNALGYHRFTYVMEDRFGNKIIAPMDVDVSNPVTITLNISTAVDQSNSNQTVLTVNGVVGSYSNFGATFTPLPTSQPVYLYYNNNLNYVEYNPVHDPLDAVLCAYDLNNPKTQPCLQSDPMYNGRSTNAGQITFATSYNSPGGVCNPPPNSLLAQSWTPCNIDNALGFSATCPTNGAGAEQFCMPVFANGTGECTSQLGLFGIVYPDANGDFSTTITACGSRQDEITAQYYGWAPEQQPVSVLQVPLALSENNVNTPGSAGAAAITGNELDYYYSPTQTTATFEIGLFELNYGEIGIAALGVGVLTVLAIIAARAVMKRSGERSAKARRASRSGTAGKARKKVNKK
jgi:hypothetical protein